MKKSILSLALAVIMVMSLLTIGAFAEGEIVEVDSYDSLVTALSTATEGTTIKLTANITLGANGLTNISGKTLTIDGNYKTITFEKTGSLTNGVFGNDTAPLYANTKLTVENLTIENTGDNGAYASIVGYHANGAEITYTGCTFKNLYAAVYVNPIESDPENGVTLNITNCNYESTLYEYAVDKTSPGTFVDAVKVTTSGNTGNFEPSESIKNVVYATVGGHTKAFSSIQAAVDAADNNSTITVAPGTYDGVVEFDGKSLTIKAQYPAYVNGVQQMDEDKLSKFTGTLYTGASSASNSFNENQRITIDGFALSGNGLKIGTTNWSTLGNLTVRHCTMTFGENLESSSIYNKPNKFIYVNGGANGAYANFVVEDNYISGQPQQDQYPLQLWGVKSAVVSNNTFMLTGAENHQAIGISKLAADASVTVTGNVINGAGGGIYVTTWKCNGDNSDFIGTVNIANNKMYGAGGSYYPVFVGYDGTDYGAFNGTLIDDNNTNNGAPVAAEVGQKPGSTGYYTVTVMSGNSVVDAATVESGTEYPLPAAPSNSGYIFLGWRSGDATYKAGEVVTITADTTFVAVWGNLPDVKPSEPSEPETPVFPFYDVTARDWYYSAVKYVYEKGLMDGVDVGVFAPNDTLTRAMVWTIIARAEGVDTTGGATWYAKAQEWVTAKGISDGENPNAAITRQELVTMLYRLAGEPAVSGNITAPDASSVSTWAQSAMTWAMNIGLVEGDENGALTPLATATRAQAAAMIMRFCESVK